MLISFSPMQYKVRHINWRTPVVWILDCPLSLVLQLKSQKVIPQPSYINCCISFSYFKFFDSHPVHYVLKVLGAAMFYAKVGDSAMLYTGDYNMTPDRHLGAAQIDRLYLDLVITEYGISNSFFLSMLFHF